jgi:putative selenate reductase
MSDFFSPVSIENLTKIALQQLQSNHFFCIPEKLFFKSKVGDSFKSIRFGKMLDAPIGVAAGPQTQLSQNIVMAWMVGARYIELKTVQTLDELEISKPCIDMQDEGYNCEWSQELKLQKSFDEYLNAWILIHIISDYLKLEHHGAIFNMSVGYNMEGIKNPNIQKFFEKMSNCKIEKDIKIEKLKNIYPNIVNLQIPDTISDNITLSTMHGCPANEIEDIANYLLEEKKLHTVVKLNPTLLGSEKLRFILNEKCGFPAEVPDAAFDHDLKYIDAIAMISRLQKKASVHHLFFGLKLTNTLESVNNKAVFGKENSMMYLSGRALHPISVNVAAKLQADFGGTLDISFSGGADAFNTPDLIACGLNPVTVCSDLLKPGGYGRLAQYISELRLAFKQNSAKNCDEFILSKSHNERDLSKAKASNLLNYAAQVIEDEKYKRVLLKDISIKTKRKLSDFDCIAAPCTDTCPTNQAIPDYMYYAANGEFDKAFEVILETNPFPGVTGMVCDHECQTKCTRINYDNSLRIRDVKRFIAEKNEDIKPLLPQEKNEQKVAVIGAGPSGLSCAYFLSRAGFDVSVYEEKSRAGGMAAFAIPSFRLSENALNQDIERIEKSGVKIYFNTKVNIELYEKLREDNNYVYLAVGAKKARKIGLTGENIQGILDPLKFLENIKTNGDFEFLGNHAAIIGGGNTAMDTARTVKRLISENGKVKIIYRRAKKEMPADQEEITALLNEGIEIIEHADIKEIKSINGNLYSLVLNRMKAGEKDSDGRSRPVVIEGSEFEMEFDTLIPAVGQDLDIFISDKNLLKTKSGSFETQTENVFIGGDAHRGAATIIKAIADGRFAAEEIIKKNGKQDVVSTRQNAKKIALDELMAKKSVRLFGVPVRETSFADRHNFKVVQYSMTEPELREEAARCLLCDEVCNICTTVCPNGANYSFDMKPVKYHLQKISFDKDGNTKFIDDGFFEISQKHQIINIGNWCNECGNCETFCPTSGAPYKDKPKFYLTRESFAEEEKGYFIEKTAGLMTILYRNRNENFELSRSGDFYLYKTQQFAVSLQAKTFKIKDVKVFENGLFEIKLENAVKMSVFLNALSNLYFE